MPRYIRVLNAKATNHGIDNATGLLWWRIGDGLLRYSVGLESVEDLIADLEQALEG